MENVDKMHFTQFFFFLFDVCVCVTAVTEKGDESPTINAKTNNVDIALQPFDNVLTHFFSFYG